MANIKSAKKRIKIIKRNTLRNRQVKAEIQALIKELNKKHAAKADTKELLKKVIKYIDTAVSKGIFHWKAAARKKTKLVKKLAKA